MEIVSLEPQGQRLSIHLSICLSTDQPIYVSIYPSRLSIHLCICQSFNLPIYVSIHQSIYSSIYFHIEPARSRGFGWLRCGPQQPSRRTRTSSRNQPRFPRFSCCNPREFSGKLIEFDGQIYSTQLKSSPHLQTAQAALVLQRYVKLRPAWLEHTRLFDLQELFHLSMVSPSLTHSHTLTHTLSLSHTHTLSLSHTHTHSLSRRGSSTPASSISKNSSTSPWLSGRKRL